MLVTRSEGAASDFKSGLSRPIHAASPFCHFIMISDDDDDNDDEWGFKNLLRDSRLTRYS